VPRRVTPFIVTAACLALVSVPGIAVADQSGQATVTASLTVGAPLLRSVTVTPASFTYQTCVTAAGRSTGASLANPNGRCQSRSLVVTVGDVASVVRVTTSVLSPAGGSTPWIPCSATAAPLCTNAGTPGQDQVLIQVTRATQPATLASPSLLTAPSCDALLSPACAMAPARSSAAERITLTGPSLSTDSAKTWTHTLTWTAVAP